MGEDNPYNIREYLIAIGVSACLSAAIFYPALKFCDRQMMKGIYGIVEDFGKEMDRLKEIQNQQPEEQRVREGHLFLIL